MAILSPLARKKEFIEGVYSHKVKTPLLWKYFAEIFTIPRPTRSEGPIVDHLQLLAENSDFTFERDTHNNILIHVPATPGYENAPKILLQGHSDMVAKMDTDSKYDPKVDGVHAIVKKDGSITADKTTLGADNGIGLAMALTLASDSKVKHGEFGILITTEEEDGMGGVENLNFESIKNFDININMDWEIEGQAVIGSAGGGYDFVETPFEKISRGDKQLYSLDISGLVGDPHSGLMIDKGGGNSIRILTSILSRASKDLDINLVSFNGGGALNAIPKESTATIAVRSDQIEELNSLIQESKERIREELKMDGEKLNFNVGLSLSNETSDEMLTSDSTAKVLQLISDLPNGVKEMDGKNVITSTNLAKIETGADSFRISFMSRSAISKKLEEQRQDIKKIALSKDDRIKFESGISFAGWEPKYDTQIVEVAKRVYIQLTNKELEIGVTHAGLECGSISLKYPNLLESTISLGPTITGAHGTNETTSIESVENTYEFVAALINELSKRI